MAKDKDRALNPAQQQRKLEKAKALKKGKAEQQSRKNEKLARRNPDRLQRQIDDLKALGESGQIKPREKQVLADLERGLKAIRKAREALGDKAPEFGGHGNQHERRGDNDGSVLGKRDWNGNRKPGWHGKHGKQEEGSGSETDESVRRIPMPKDTPPPIPREYRRNPPGTNANSEPLGGGRGGGGRQPHALTSKPVAVQEAKTTYESAPQIRDLKKEAVRRFVPNVVRRKQEAVKGVGGLVEPEELDRLEQEGYTPQTSKSPTGLQTAPTPRACFSFGVDAAPFIDAEAEARRLAEEEERFQREIRHAQVEEVEDVDV